MSWRNSGNSTCPESIVYRVSYSIVLITLGDIKAHGQLHSVVSVRIPNSLVYLRCRRVGNHSDSVDSHYSTLISSCTDTKATFAE